MHHDDCDDVQRNVNCDGSTGEENDGNEDSSEENENDAIWQLSPLPSPYSTPSAAISTHVHSFKAKEDDDDKDDDDDLYHDQGSKSNILKVAMKSKMTVLKYFPGLVLLTTTGFDPKTSLVH